MTDSARFVLPMLYNKDRSSNFFITKNFENCYIGDANFPNLGKKIFLLYTYQMNHDYIKFERKLELIPEFCEDYDYSSERQVMYVFDIPEEHVEDFKLFLEGKYSKFSDSLKEKITAFWGAKRSDSVLYGAVYANDAAKEFAEKNDFDTEDGEFWRKPVLSREIYMSPN